MKWPGFLSPSFLSKAGWKYAVGVTLLIVACVVWLMAQDVQKPFKSGGGKAQIQGRQVPFVSGPKDQNGRVYQVSPPPSAISVPRHMTEEGDKAKQLAETGNAVSTTKPLARELSSADAKALHVTLPSMKSSRSLHI